MRRTSFLAWVVVVAMVGLTAGCDAWYSLWSTEAAPATETYVLSEQDHISDYDAAVAAYRQGECEGVRWVNLGRCNELRFVTETTGYSGNTRYFDSEDGALVDAYEFADVDASQFEADPSAYCDDYEVIERLCTEQ